MKLNLLFYKAQIDTDVRFTRLDTEKEIGINYHPEKVVNPMQVLMSAIGPDATPQIKRHSQNGFKKW